MKATRALLAAMVLATVIGANQANAQCTGNAGSCNTTNTASVTVGVLVKLDMSSATTTLTNPTIADIEAGNSIDNLGPLFTIKANRTWSLKLKSQNASSWSYSGTDAGVKSIGDLAWATSAAGTYTPLTASDATLTSSASASNGATQQVYFRTSWVNDFSSVSNAPGTYTLPIIFTLTAP